MMGLLQGMRRCPHCSIAEPRLEHVWSSDGATHRSDGGTTRYWGAFKCSTCGGIVTVSAERPGSMLATARVDQVIPAEKAAHLDLPPIARTFLQQAYETLNAPDAATVMAASAVDAMLKAVGYADGTLNSRIKQALTDNVLTDGMATWAHSVRLEANNVRHADEEKPHATPEEAKQAVDFAEALGNFLFVLTARVKRGIEAAQAATSDQTKAPVKIQM